MNFGDIFKKAFLKAASTSDITMKNILMAMGITCVLAAYLFLVYRLITRKTFYNKTFGIALATIPLIVCAIVLAIQSSLVVSLGMVGALSIVRFRTAIKDPMDLVFLFWAIAVGIICGASLPGVALIMTAVLTVAVLILDNIPVARAPMLLIVHADSKSLRPQIMEAVKANSSAEHVKSQTTRQDTLDMIIEVRTKQSEALTDAVSAIPGVSRCSLLDHEGEVTF